MDFLYQLLHKLLSHDLVAQSKPTDLLFNGLLAAHKVECS